MAIVKRTTKGSPLTYAELDNNFTELEAAKIPAGGTAGQVLSKINGTDYNDQWSTLPAASETVAGVAELATQAEVDTGTDAERIVTPATLAAWSGLPAAASLTAAGLVELATQAEADTGTDADRAITPATLAGWSGLPAAASLTAAGLVELATQAEVDTGTDADRAVSPATLAGYAGIAQATDTAKGTVELATQAEVDTGTDTDRAVTPATLAGKLTSAGVLTTGGTVVDDLTALRNAILAITAKLDLDGGVSGTDFAAVCDPAALTTT